MITSHPTPLSGLAAVLMRLVFVLLVTISTASLRAETPSTSYVFPAGGQRGSKVAVRIGGHYLHDRCRFELLGPGIVAPQEILRTETRWFEGPLIYQPASQQKEDYPQDYAADFEIAADAPLGKQYWRVWNSQGATSVRPFVIGDLPEVVEEEIDGDPIPVSVPMPATVNGRIFPREDVDVWRFTAKKGEPVTCAVAAGSLGSPLEAQLEVRDLDGRRIGDAAGAVNRDPVLRFVPPRDGEYLLRIQDVRSAGLQHFVYRLTITDGPWVDSIYPLGGKKNQVVTLAAVGSFRGPIEEKLSAQAGTIESRRLILGGRLTNPILIAIDDLPEVLETEANTNAGVSAPVSTPVVLNGRIDPPGDVDSWSIVATKDEKFVCEVQAAQLDSRLHALVTVSDDKGKEIVRGDMLSQQGSDPVVTWTTPTDGRYVIRIADRFASRGGERFGYRLKVHRPQPRMRLEFATDIVNVPRGGQQKLIINVVRAGGCDASVTLAVAGLPEGMQAAEITVAGNQTKGEITIHATAQVTTRRVRVVGRTAINGQEIELTAVAPTGPGQPPLDHVLLAVTMPTPFKFDGVFALTYASVGSIYRKHFVLERNGYTGPLQVCLADRQTRHLQGVTGPIITVPADATEFFYPVTLAPWMELGRTSRAVIMATGEVVDAQGEKHKVCYTNAEPNCQLANIVSPSQLKIVLSRSSLLVASHAEARLPFEIRRSTKLAVPIRVELVVPRHVLGVQSAAVELDSAATAGTLTIRFGEHPGPFNAPLRIRATSIDTNPLSAEVTLECVVE